MQKTTEVLIAGAGPTGLMLACQLALHGVPFIIIDTNEDHTTQSRAFGIHAATMEIFSQLGVIDKFLELGKQVKALNTFVKGKLKNVPLLDFGRGLTEYPFMLSLEQSKTEKLLIDFLKEHGGEVTWNTELKSFTQNNENVQATVRHKDGSEETIIANWLVGADGAKSVVRHVLNLPFGGQTYPLDLFVLDCKIDWTLKNNELYLAFSDYSFALFFPLPEDTCRIVGTVPKEFTGKTDLKFEDVNNGFAERMQMDVKLRDPKWISAYRAHHRYVSEFKKGRCFLAGDAAHIHSPVGAQGMNTGLEDACNLAWKLALVVKKQAKETLLLTYQEERLPFARRLVKTTDRMFNMMVSENGFVRFVREHILSQLLPVILKVKFLARFAFRNLSQIGIAYSETALLKNSSYGSFSSKAPKPGERLPFVAYEDALGKQANIQQFIKGVKFHLLVFSKGTRNAESAFVSVAEKYKEIISTEIIQLKKGTDDLQKKLSIKEAGCYLVRPDFYIAYRSKGINVKHFEHYLKAFLLL